VLPNWLAHDDVKKKRLLRVLPDRTPSPTELYMLYPTRLSVTPKLNAFVKFIESVVL
jgi:DNA-binding transcriptional LysR family regulator